MKYIDTSSFVKYYGYHEKGKEEILDLVDSSKSGTEVLISSFLLMGECVSAFDKWARYKFISLHQSHGIIKKFILEAQEMSNSGSLILEPISTITITNSLDLISKHHLSINDAVHLYTALCNKLAIEEFICTDDSLGKAAQKEGFVVFNPEKKK